MDKNQDYKTKKPNLFTNDKISLSYGKGGFGHSIENYPIKNDNIAETINSTPNLDNSELNDLTQSFYNQFSEYV
eukprot:Pgem_evm2s9056